MFDPALTSGSTDSEAGGEPASPQVAPQPPTRMTPDRSGPGLRLTPRVWYLAALLVVVALVIAGAASWFGA
ncbi:hypothetical protein [Brevundimonas sp.]|uniref:hypothetical protein n=1 Tax=Brevundimonas sp. TaxID=1871086 RepID=UPI0039193F90